MYLNNGVLYEYVLHKHKYKQIKNALDYFFVHSKLIVVLKEEMELLAVEQKHNELLKAMSSLHYIFKFIIRSRVLFAA